MGARYSVNRAATALSTTTDLLTITAPATRALKLHSIRVGGGGTASAANEIGIYRPTTVGVTPTAIVPLPLSTGSAAAVFTAASTWTTQPVIPATPIARIPVNSNGSYVPIVAIPGVTEAIEIPPSGQLSIRSVSGTGLVTIDVTVEEVG